MRFNLIIFVTMHIRANILPLIWAAALTLTTVLLPQVEARQFAFSNSAKPATKGEVEIETWVTWKTGKDSDSDFTRFDFRHEIEYGLSERMLLGIYLPDWRYEENSSGSEASFRDVGVELIYNFTDPSTDPVGFSLYNEIRGGNDLFILENKLLFQKNVGRWKFVYNNVVEAEWEGDDLSDSKGEFQQTLGIHRKLNDWLYGGIEGFHEIEYADWSDWEDSTVYLGPSFRVKPGGAWSFVIAPTFQLSDVDSAPDFVTRLVFGWEF